MLGRKDTGRENMSTVIDCCPSSALWYTRRIAGRELVVLDGVDAGIHHNDRIQRLRRTSDRIAHVSGRMRIGTGSFIERVLTDVVIL